MDKLFSEIYNRYFMIVNRILSRKGKITAKRMGEAVQKDGFGESMLFLLPKLTENAWELFEEENGEYRPKLRGVKTPLSRLQKRWLATLLSDPRAALFLDEKQLLSLRKSFQDSETLYDQGDFRYFDRFSDGDDYADEGYRERFRSILKAIKEERVIRIRYESRSARYISLTVRPLYLEYSMKNDCYRLLGIVRSGSRMRKSILRLSRMKSIVFRRDEAEAFVLTKEEPKQEKLVLRISDERNAMERAMLQFADYRKNTQRLDDRSYRCEIFYDREDETELLIEVLSFGPMIRVEGDEHFLSLVKERLKKQEAFPASC